MDNNRIILPFTVTLASETKKIKIPLKGKGVLETITFYSDGVATLNHVYIWQRKQTKGLRIIGEAHPDLTDDLTNTVTNRFSFGENPLTLMLNVKYENTFIELWIESDVTNDIGFFLRIFKYAEKEVKK